MFGNSICISDGSILYPLNPNNQRPNIQNVVPIHLQLFKVFK